jgi:hypothetical protein
MELAGAFAFSLGAVALSRFVKASFLEGARQRVSTRC